MTRTMSPGPRTGAVQIPASKSQAHRMLICAALSKAPSRLVLDGFSADIEATVQCLEALGARCEETANGLSVTPVGVCPAQARLDVGESGSTLRFLLPAFGRRFGCMGGSRSGLCPRCGRFWRRTGCSCGRTGPFCIRLGNYARETIPCPAMFPRSLFPGFCLRCRF